MERQKSMNKIAILGAGTVGSTIAIALAQKGIRVIVKSRYENDKIFRIIEPKLTNAVKSGSLSEREVEMILNNIIGTVDWELITDVDLIIESIIENLEEKQKLFEKLDKLCVEKTIFSSNTSSLQIKEIASYITRKDKFIGIHFLNPAYKMPLVEIAKTSETSKETLEKVINFIRKIDKDPVIVPDIPGFILNRLLILMINEAINMVNENVATPQDIDKVLRLGANHPMGPLALADYIGLDTLLMIIKNLYRFFGDKYEPSSRLEEMVKSSKLGRKTGEGFYKYD